jgi:hypothetical protein
LRTSRCLDMMSGMEGRNVDSRRGSQWDEGPMRETKFKERKNEKNETIDTKERWLGRRRFAKVWCIRMDDGYGYG